MEEKIKVGLAVLNVNLIDLQQIINEAGKNEIDYLHLDMTDGNYANNFGLNNETIRKICSEEGVKTRIHLMVFNPEKYLEDFNTEEVYIHFHSTSYLLNFTRKAEQGGFKKGLVISPNTDFRETYEALKYFDEILFMGVNPGKWGEDFLEEVAFNLQDFVLNRPFEGGAEFKKIVIGLEGGITEKNYKKLKNIGVTDFVVGSAYLNSKNKKDFVRRIKYS